MVKVINAELTGMIDHHRARGLIWMLRQLGEQIFDAVLEPRVRELEAKEDEPEPARLLN